MKFNYWILIITYPCSPAPNGTWNDFTTDGKNHNGDNEAYGAATTYFPYFINGVQQVANGTPTFVQSARNGRYYAQGNVKVWYPAPGQRYYDTGRFVGLGYSGYSWTLTASNTSTYYFDLHYGRIFPGNTWPRGFGLQVRCLRE